MGIGLIIVLLLLVFGWIAAWIVVWVKGSQKQNTLMVVLGGLFTLGIIGLIIAIIQSSSWQNQNMDIELQKQKLELERQKLELEKQKQNEDKE